MGIILPVPWQRGQVCCSEKKPWVTRTWPCPLQVVQVIGFVACDPGFGEQPEVVNGCSDLLVEVLGEAGRHTRAAVGTGARLRTGGFSLKCQQPDPDV